AGAVEDAIDAADAIAGKPFLDGFDHRNATGDRGFVAERSALLLSHARERGAVMGQQRLVRGHDSTPALDRRFDALARDSFDTAYQLDEDVSLRLPRHFDGVAEPGDRPKIDAAIAAAVTRRDGYDADRTTGPPLDQFCILRQQPHHARADGAEAGNRNRKRLGRGHELWTLTDGEIGRER